MRYFRISLILSLIFIVSCAGPTEETDAGQSAATAVENSVEDVESVTEPTVAVVEDVDSGTDDSDSSSAVEPVVENEAESANGNATNSAGDTPFVTIQADEACPADAFADVSTYVQNQDYPAPELSVECTADSVIIRSNGIPNFEFVQLTPSELTEQAYEWTIPLNPTPAAEATELPLLGTVAISVNGLPIFGPNEAANGGYGDPFLDEILDFCNGHTGGRGDYHLHARPECIFEEIEGNVGLVIGYALDGYPILAPFVCDDSDCSFVSEVQSSWQRTTDVVAAWDAHEYIEGSGDLDECNGMETEAGYAYFATDTFPYIVGCFYGNVAAAPGGQGDQGQGGPPQGGAPGGDRPAPPPRGDG